MKAEAGPDSTKPALASVSLRPRGKHLVSRFRDFRRPRGWMWPGLEGLLGICHPQSVRAEPQMVPEV